MRAAPRRGPSPAGSLDASMPEPSELPRRPSSRARCTVVMLAQNEETADRRCRCRACVEHGFPVVVVDGGSTDANRRDSRGPGRASPAPSVRQHVRPAQLGRSTESTSDYVLVVDADEIMSPELAAEIETAVRAGVSTAAWVPSIDYFAGRWLVHYPQRHLRLFRRGSGRFENEIHQRFAFDVENPTIVELTGPARRTPRISTSAASSPSSTATRTASSAATCPAAVRRRCCTHVLRAEGRRRVRSLVLRPRWLARRTAGFIHSVYLGAYRFTLWAKAATAQEIEPPTARSRDSPRGAGAASRAEPTSPSPPAAADEQLAQACGRRCGRRGQALVAQVEEVVLELLERVAARRRRSRTSPGPSR